MKYEVSFAELFSKFQKRQFKVVKILIQIKDVLIRIIKYIISHKIYRITIILLITFAIIFAFISLNRPTLDYNISKKFLSDTVLYSINIKTSPHIKIMFSNHQYITDSMGNVTIDVDFKDLKDGDNILNASIYGILDIKYAEPIKINKRVDIPSISNVTNKQEVQYDYFSNTLNLKGEVSVTPIHSKVIYLGETLKESSPGTYPYQISIKNAVNENYKVKVELKTRIESLEGVINEPINKFFESPEVISTDLTIISPKEKKVATREIIIKGKTSPNTDITINNSSAEVNKQTGDFTKAVVLNNPEGNTFSISAKNPFAKPATMELTLSRNLTSEEQKKIDDDENAKKQQEAAIKAEEEKKKEFCNHDNNIMDAQAKYKPMGFGLSELKNILPDSSITEEIDPDTNECRWKIFYRERIFIVLAYGPTNNFTSMSITVVYSDQTDEETQINRALLNAFDTKDILQKILGDEDTQIILKKTTKNAFDFTAKNGVNVRMTPTYVEQGLALVYVLHKKK